MEIVTKSATETKELGRRIGSELVGGGILALEGDLGSGKTTFIQGIAEALGVSERLISPTFIIVRSYQSEEKGITLFHIDLYRLEENIKREIENLGIMEEWGKKDNITIVEWANKASEVFPKNTKWITFKYLNENSRKITIK